jgi:hypothetical protein
MWLSCIKADRKGGIYATGVTHAADLPVLHPVQEHLRGGSDAFLLRVNENTLKSTLFTYFGGSAEDGAWGVSMTTGGDPVIVGYTNSSDLPASGRSFQRSLRGGKDAFVARFPQYGHARPVTTYFGGTGDDAGGAECHGCAGAAITADAENIWIAGVTVSSDLPLKGASELPKKPAAQHGFIAALTPSLDKLCFSSYADRGEEGALEGITLTHSHSVLASGFSYSLDVQRAVIDDQSRVSLRLNGKPVHAVLIESNVQAACQ